MAAKLFVGGLSWGTTDDKLREFFSQAGTVVSATVIIDRFSGKSKGFGFVEMSTPEEAEQAKLKLNGQSLDDRTIAINDARPQAPRENRFGGGGGSFDRNSGGGGGRPDRKGRGGRY